MKKKPLMIMIAGLIALPIMDLAQAQQVDRSYSRCISLDSKSNSLTAFWINNCNQRLNVSWSTKAAAATVALLQLVPGDGNLLETSQAPTSWSRVRIRKFRRVSGSEASPTGAARCHEVRASSEWGRREHARLPGLQSLTPLACIAMSALGAVAPADVKIGAD